MAKSAKEMTSDSVFFSITADRYVATFDALQEILTLAPHAAKIDAISADGAFIEAELRHLSPEKRQAASQVMRAIAMGLTSVLEDSLAEGTRSQAAQEIPPLAAPPSILAYKNASHAITTPAPGPRESTEKAGFEIKIPDQEIAEVIKDIFYKMNYMVRQPKKDRILLSSLVVMAVSAFEVLVNQLATAYFRLYPGAIGGSEKEFSLDDLRIFATIEDAREAAIERRVESIGRGLIEWEKWFKTHLKIEFDRLCINWTVTQEIFQRRHILIHNDGRVSRQYLSKVSSMTNSPLLGTQLDVDEQYVGDALDQLSTFGLSLVIATWVTLIKGDIENAAFSLMRAIHKYTGSGRWQVVRTLCDVSVKLKVKQSLRLEFDYHGWLARKRLEGTKSIMEVVEGWDVSALSDGFKIIRLCLLDRVDEVMKVLPSALESGDVSVKQLRQLSIFEELRAHPKFDLTITMQQEGGRQDGDLD